MIKSLDAPQLVVMLTRNDLTVDNASDVFESCSHSKAKIWGMKEKPLPIEEMKRIFARMKEAGKTTVLEVVEYDEENGLEGARIAAECGCDILMGTKFHMSILKKCHNSGIRYFPFVGSVDGRPSRLIGDHDEIIKEAKDALANGADGIDLLGYRYVGDAVALINSLVKNVEAPVIVAGSIDSDNRLDEIKKASPWGFTIGSAFFDNRFGTAMPEEIDHVVDYVSN